VVDIKARGVGMQVLKVEDSKRRRSFSGSQ
jgi:hypothetical protein